jgi:cation:H+ antiporter
MLTYLEFLVVGFYALIKGADMFVDGSSAVAKRFRVPGAIIGLTIVAMGTSAPELAVSVTSALKGSNELAISNVIGSNLFNVLMVLGICAILHPVPVDSSILKRDFPLNILVTLAMLIAAPFGLKAALAAAGDAGLKMSDKVYNLGRLIGIGMLIFFIIYMVVLIMEARKNPTAEEEDAGEPMPMSKTIFSIVFGIILIVSGGEAVVESAKNIAYTLGMSETLVGLTIVAVGTSLPELVTSIVAAKKGEVDMAVGNVVGSSIFNIMLILGVSCTILPVGVNFASMIDIGILLLVGIISFIYCLCGKKVGRVKGITMVAMYVAYVVFAYLRDVG